MNDNCWIWARWIRPNGYGHIQVNKKNWLAHKFVYTCLVGEVPEGMELDHLCRNKACINPDHLEPVTRLENVQRGEAGKFNQSKTHCPRGHEYTPENTRYITRKVGRYIRRERRCEPCGREQSLAYYYNHKEIINPIRNLRRRVARG